jgi:hypothetical protein
MAFLLNLGEATVEKQAYRQQCTFGNSDTIIFCKNQIGPNIPMEKSKRTD